ncbi:MAG: DUF3488 domain-containing protein, partial [Nitrospiraceae bacterium]|nr:DUF3488 domain-containing protein [Nitrospiraceae bacterium]
GLYVLILLVTHKLCTLQDHADFLHLSVLSFLEFLAAAVLTVELWYGIVFILYLVSTVWTLLLWHLSLESREATHNCGAKQAPDGLPLTVRFFWATNIMAVAALGLTLAIFLAMPRTGFGFFQKAGGTPVRTTGFSDKVDLGGIGAVKQDSRLVMRVQFPDLDGPPAEALYFRGAAFDRYNGRSWTNTFARRRRVIRNDDGIFTAAAERPQAAHTAVIRQQILIEALDTSVLFGIPFAEEIKGEFPAVQTDWMDGWSLPVPATARYQYVVRSEAPRIDDEERPAATFHYPERIKTHFLQLPRLNPQIAELTSSITRHAKTPYEQILSIQQYLMSHYRYSVDVGVEDTLHPLDDFLFTRKTGYASITRPRWSSCSVPWAYRLA